MQGSRAEIAKRTDNQKGLQTCKFCVKGQHWIPLNLFYTDRAKADGLGSYCIPCQSGRTLEEVEANRRTKRGSRWW